MLRPAACLALAAFVVVGAMSVTGNTVKRRDRMNIAPAIPTTQRTPQLVFLEHADMLKRNHNDDFLTLVGNVEFSKGGMHMFTDSAHYYEQTGSFDAFGNVRMEQGDTLFVYADELNYDGSNEMAVLYGYNTEPVRLINREVMLRTDVFTYDMYNELCYYNTGGELTDRENRLESIEGEYNPKTKEANFYQNVVLTSKRPDDELRMVGEALYYNTVTHEAEFNDPTVITSKDGRIDSENGIYNTDTRIAQLFSHSTVTTARGSTLEGDTLYYDRAQGWGEALGNMALVDTAQCCILYGDYGFYNEVADSAFVTGNALGKEYSQGDTLFIHGRYLTSIRNIEERQRVISRDSVYIDIPVDTTLVALNPDSVPAPRKELKINEVTEQYLDSVHVITAWPRVRFFRTDLQGVCDSLVFTQADTTVRMYHHPVVWSENRQIFGTRMEVHLNDSTIDHARLPETGFMAQQIEGEIFNQLSGKEMDAWFVNGELHHALVYGNVEGIVFPEENDSTVNKLVNFKTSNLLGYFKGRAMERMKMWPETSGEAIPLYLAKYADLHLPGFVWYNGVRPETPESVMTVPEQMEELMSDRPVVPMAWRPKSEQLNDTEQPETEDDSDSTDN